MNVAGFVAKWRKVELKERSAAQEHFLDLCRVLGHPTPAEADPTGETFCFERGAAKHGPSTGSGQAAPGFADVWKKDFFGWEYKGRHKDLDAAFDQLLQYRDALANPPLLVVCDLGRIVVRTNFTRTVAATFEIPLEAMGEPRNLEILRAVFFDPEKLKPGRTSEAMTEEAAERLAGIAESMRKRGLDPSAVAHFLNRLVFCLFAEDIGLLPGMIFTRIVDKSGGDPARFGKLVGQLFEAMAHGGDFGVDTIRHFNGNLLENADALTMTAAEMKAVFGAAELDWGAIDPSIFGTLFERGLDPAKRSQLGAHYTGREDIETLVDAVVMAPLRREWAETRATVENVLATGRKTAGARASRPLRGWHSRGYLPHCDEPGRIQSVTFRLADSLPAAQLSQWRAELGLIAGAGGPPALPNDDLPSPERGHLGRSVARGAHALRPGVIEYHRRIEEWLNRGHGACHLRDRRIAGLVQDALLHFDGGRYRLLAWCVMPNHVHVVFEPNAGGRLEDILHSWKSFTAKEANRILRREGRFWQEEYFDRFIRDVEHFRTTIEYVEKNPVDAGLVAEPSQWEFGSAGYKGMAGAGGTPALRPAALKKARGEADSILHGFLTRLQAVRVLDPACGSGNFLYVTLQKLKDLEKEAIVFAMDRGLGGYLPRVGPWQLHGIEINPYAHDLAQTSVWIGFLQWTRANGFQMTQDPVLRPMKDNFRCMDSILGRDQGARDEGRGETVEPEWPTVDFIVGNPPFLGGKMLRRELGDTYVDRMLALWRDRVPAEADLCCYWFEKARAHIESGKCRRAGLLATQGIRGGANREVLKRIMGTGGVFWAVSDRDWILDGANVHVSMVGFDGGEEKARTLDGATVDRIHANLTGAADLTAAGILAENRGIGFMGDTKVGPFDIPEDLARSWLDLKNPNGRPNADVVRPWANGRETTGAPQRLWIVDFPPGMTEAEAAQYEAPFEYIREHVKPMRAAARSGDRTGVDWWIHQRPRPDMRAALTGLPRFLATPTVAKHRLFVWLDAVVLADHQLIAFARADDYFFGILHSRLHEVWALAMGTRLETRPRYTPTTCFETFPFPAPTDPQREAVAAAARALHEARANWIGDRSDKSRTLTALYNRRPQWLADAHAALDAAVFAAYGWPADLADGALLEKLLALNLARSGGQEGRGDG